jgi:hypothetical protein
MGGVHVVRRQLYEPFEIAYGSSTEEFVAVLARRAERLHNAQPHMTVRDTFRLIQDAFHGQTIRRYPLESDR